MFTSTHEAIIDSVGFKFASKFPLIQIMTTTDDDEYLLGRVVQKVSLRILFIKSFRILWLFLQNLSLN